MKSTPKLCLLFAALAFLAAPPDPAQGQVIQSTILGTVTDPSGGVIAGATVTVKNEAIWEKDDELLFKALPEFIDSRSLATCGG